MAQSRRDFIATASYAAAVRGKQATWPPPQVKSLLDGFGISIPFFQAGFGLSTNPLLASTISNAGGMGAIGALNAATVKGVIAAVRTATSRPFFVNMILQAFGAELNDVLSMALDAGAPIAQFSFGIPSPETASIVRRAKAKIGVQIANRSGARAALDVGADFLILQGNEAGGHVQAHSDWFAMLPGVLEEAKGKPVLAAGGISTGAQIYRAIAAGASGVLMGTRFVATKESGSHPGYKQILTNAKANDTVMTMCFGGSWPMQHRVLRNATVDMWEAAGCPPAGKRPGEGDVLGTRNTSNVFRYSNVTPLANFVGPKILEGPLYAGLGVGEIKDVPSAGDLVKHLWVETEAAHKSGKR